MEIESLKNNKNSTNNNSELILLAYKYSQSEFIYKSEVKRENSIIEQAGRMQSVFAFMTAAIFTGGALIVQNNHTLHPSFLIIAFSSIALFLLSSLVFATCAQTRLNIKTMDSGFKTVEYIDSKSEIFIKRNAQLSANIELVNKLQKRLEEENDNRIRFLYFSKFFFIVSIINIWLWFIISIISIREDSTVLTYFDNVFIPFTLTMAVTVFILTGIILYVIIQKPYLAWIQKYQDYKAKQLEKIGTILEYEQFQSIKIKRYTDFTLVWLISFIIICLLRVLC